jgi:hypothetical protein
LVTWLEKEKTRSTFRRNGLFYPKTYYYFYLLSNGGGMD